MSENLDRSSMEFHCSHLGADGVAANFSGSWRAWGQIDPGSVALKPNAESVYSLMERVGLTFTPLVTPVLHRSPITGRLIESEALMSVYNGAGDLLATVGSTYSVVSHWETLESILGTILEECPPSRIISFGRGARMLAQFLIASDYVAAGRKHNGFLTISNGLDGRTALRAGWTLYTPVCSNTYAAALYDLSVTRRHTKNFRSSLAAVAHQVGLIRDDYHRTMALLDRAASLDVSEGLVAEFLTYMMPKVEGTNSKAVDNRRAELALAIQETVQEVGTGDRVSAYDLFGAATRYVAARQQNRTDEDQYEYVSYGPGGAFSQKALNWVTGYVNSR